MRDIDYHNCYTSVSTTVRSIMPFSLKQLFVAALIALSLLSFRAEAQDRGQGGGEWQTHQYALLAGALALHAADWSQTRQIAQPGSGYYEAGPVAKSTIGSNPSTGQVDIYMIATAGVIVGVAHLLPEYRTAILATWAASRLAVVVHNNSIGLRIGGSF